MTGAFRRVVPILLGVMVTGAAGIWLAGDDAGSAPGPGSSVGPGLQAAPAEIPVAAASPPAPPTPTPTTAADKAAAPAPTPEVFVVGDSLTVGAARWLGPELAARGWLATGVDAVVGRHAAQGLEVLAGQAQLPPTVLVALGTNDLASPPDVAAGWVCRARALVGDRRLLWVNLSLDDRAHPRLRNYHRVNSALAEGAARCGAELLDWNAWAATQGVRTAPDGIHYGAAGYRQRARFYAAALTGTL